MLLNYQEKNSVQNQIESYVVWTEKTIRSSGKVEATVASPWQCWEQLQSIHYYRKTKMHLLIFNYVVLSEEWMRPITKSDKYMLVHWWYYPDR